MRFTRAFAIAAALLGTVPAARPAVAAPPAGTAITNVATATYVDGAGHPEGAVSNTVSVTVAPVSGGSIGSGGNGCGSAIAPFQIGPDLVLQFTIVNTSNVPDAYKILSVTTNGGTVKSLSFSGSFGSQNALPGSTVSPTVPPGGAIAVMVDLATTGIAPGTETIVTLAVRTTNAATMNGVQTISAQACGQGEAGPVIGAPVLAQTGPPVKLVNGLPSISAASGAVVTYTVGYMNHGGMPATGVTMTDPLPAGVAPQLASVTLDGQPVGTAATLAGNTLTVALGTAAPAQAHVVAFKATVNVTTLGAPLVNIANFTSYNAASVASTAASIVEGLADVVFDGALGAGNPLAGSTLTLVPATGAAQPVTLQGQPVAPNAANADPFVTGSDGSYGLGLGTAQVGSGRFQLLVAAPGYTSRRFALTLTPDANGVTYDATVAASDGAALALPGSFALTHATSVTLHDVYGVFGNLPLFKPQSIVISKNVDRAQASAGDRLIYTIALSSAASALGPTTAIDVLPRDVLYAPGTARVDGTRVDPAISGNTLAWSFPTLSTQHTIVFAAVVAPGAVEGTSLVNVATATGTLPGVNAGTTTASASASTFVVGGALSDRSVVLGRVFVDRVGDGHFHRGDTGVAKVRVFLEDGESVQTDADGLFSFPSVRPGMHVLHLDPDSLPATLRAFAVKDYNDPRSPIRLVHGPFDGGLMSDVEFAVKPR